MKLRYKIFFSILLVSLTALLISTAYLINKNHLTNISREQERSLNEYEFIRTSLANSIDFAASNKETLGLMFERFGDYYKERDIQLIFHQNEELIYSSMPYLEMDSYQPLLTVRADALMVQVIRTGDQRLILVSGQISEMKGNVLIYARDITELYLSRSQSILLTGLLSVILVFILSLLSYLYSRWITRPLERLHEGALSIAGGDYSVRITETKDEFNDMGIAFNSMAAAVLARTSELEQKAKELQVFIDDLSHEMNTPLTSIQGYAQFLLNAKASEEQKIMSAENILNQALRMKDINTKLLTITLAREYSIDPVPVQLGELFEELKTTFSPQLTEQQVFLEAEIQVDAILMDRTLILMLLGNLIKNSMQAVQSGGKIVLKAYYFHNWPVIEVSDNGIGIPEDKINDITKPFFRVDKSRSRKTGGAGLGLSICKKIAELHHADFLIESNFGKGTTVRIIFQGK